MNAYEILFFKNIDGYPDDLFKAYAGKSTRYLLSCARSIPQVCVSDVRITAHWIDRYWPEIRKKLTDCPIELPVELIQLWVTVDHRFATGFLHYIEQSNTESRI